MSFLEIEDRLSSSDSNGEKEHNTLLTSPTVLSPSTDETLWDKYINDECLSDRDGQGYRNAAESVSFEISSADEAGMTTQNTSQSFGFNQDLFAVNDPANLNIGCDQTGWGFTGAAPSNHHSAQESQVKRKSRISACEYVKCPHCSKPFTSKLRLWYYHVANCHSRITRSNICDLCGRQFAFPKDINRHKEAGSCPELPVKSTFACTCGKSYSRKDGLQRHIRTETERCRNNHHEAF